MDTYTRLAEITWENQIGRLFDVARMEEMFSGMFGDANPFPPETLQGMLLSTAAQMQNRLDIGKPRAVALLVSSFKTALSEAEATYLYEHLADPSIIDLNQRYATAWASTAPLLGELLHDLYQNVSFSGGDSCSH